LLSRNLPTVRSSQYLLSAKKETDISPENRK